MRAGRLLAALCVALAPVVALQVPLCAQTEPKDAGEEIVRLEAWPELAPELEKRVQRDVERLSSAADDAAAAEPRAALIEAGAGCVPKLLSKLAKEKDEAGRRRLAEAAEALCGAPHTRLLAAEFASKSQAVRTFALRRAAAFPDPGTLAPAEAAFARTSKIEEPSDTDLREHLAAALAVTAAGSLQGLDVLFERAKTGWGAHGAAMRTALEAVRGAEATQRMFAKLESSDRAEQTVALKLLAGCGDKSAIGRVKPFLSNADNSLRVAAINALRGIVDGDPPLEKLPVFDAIEMAKSWESRV